METIQSTTPKVGKATDNNKHSFAYKVQMAELKRRKGIKIRPITIESCLPMFAQGAVVVDWFYTGSPEDQPGNTTPIPFGAFRSFMESSGLLDEFIEAAEVRPANRFEYFLAYHEDKFLQECVLKYMRKEMLL